jgi:hypothetical protein
MSYSFSHMSKTLSIQCKSRKWCCNKKDDAKKKKTHEKKIIGYSFESEEKSMLHHSPLEPVDQLDSMISLMGVEALSL